MKNIESYKKQVDESAQTRYELNEVLWKEMKDAGLIFENFFKDKMKVFFNIKNMLYYKAGVYPSENSPARLDTLMHQVRDTVVYLDYLGLNHEFEEFTRKYGLTISLQKEKLESEEINIDEKLFELWNNLFHEDFDRKLSRKEILQKLVNHCMTLQGEICATANTIKKDAAKSVEIENGIKKKNFIRAVKIGYKHLKSAEKGRKELKSIRDQDIMNLDDAISIFKENVLDQKMTSPLISSLHPE
jgi:hypothetical protein